MPTVFETTPQVQPHAHSSVPEVKPISSRKHDRMNLFTAFAQSPVGVKFETQHAEEEVVLFMRQHFVLNVPWIMATILLIAAPFAIIPFIFTFLPLLPPLPPAYYLIGLLFWYEMVLGYALVNFIKWYYNIYIVTTERVVDIDFIQLLYKKFSEARLGKIEDVSFSSGGFLATMVDFGNVYIQTAGENTNFEFESVPHPANVVQTIGGLIKNNSRSEN